jgi:predicted nucleic acid-binding Zn ribbon protein
VGLYSKCEHCGQQYTKVRSNQRFCSTRCREIEAYERHYKRKTNAEKN